MCDFLIYRAIRKTAAPEAEILIEAMQQYKADESALVDGGLSDSTPSAVSLPQRPRRDSRRLQDYYAERIAVGMRPFTVLIDSFPEALKKRVLSKYD